MLYRRGIALPFVLMVITLLLVAVSTVTTQGLGSLHQAKVEQFSKQAVFAAEAGASDALEQLFRDASWSGPIAETTMELGCTYSATILNNLAPGGGAQTASNGMVVPEGYAYILARGTQGTIQRRVGVLVAPGSSTAFGLAVGVGGGVKMSGNKNVLGTVKASNLMEVSGNSNFQPLDGSGGLLAGSVQGSGNTRVDESQAVRAYSSISGNIRGTDLLFPNENSDATAPFINDKRTTNAKSPGEKGWVLPYPDQNVLLNATHNEGGSHLVDTPNPGDFNLNGETWYFPYGLDMSGGDNITGEGTIIAGGPVKFSGNHDVRANIIVIQVDPIYDPVDPSLLIRRGSVGPLTIGFSGNHAVDGLLFSEQNTDISGNFNLNGVLIVYNGDLDTGGNTTVKLNSTTLGEIPAFQQWASGPGGVAPPPGAQPNHVVFWERL